MKCSGLNGWLLDELRRFTLGPGIIGNAQVDAAGDGRMVVEKNYLNGIGVGVNKSSFAVVLKGFRAGLAGVGDDAVGDFQAVDVGLILLVAAEGAAEGIGNETEYREKQEKGRKRGPILEAANLPSITGS